MYRAKQPLLFNLRNKNSIRSHQAVHDFINTTVKVHSHWMKAMWFEYFE